jgi:hypothetical protein
MRDTDGDAVSEGIGADVTSRVPHLLPRDARRFEFGDQLLDAVCAKGHESL